ncbi:hypothetical protein SEA_PHRAPPUCCINO_183 [Mycobacterium phage Phrappuccino]|uniref:Uncharacterized protein n=1 Tax=Mycobacterium phage Phrappuccino TaxID=2591223 RepID=A0A514DE32_9CAUD|nr:hypothetical protein KHQ87_gp183 [Mycobacterium phage Phrappuccino]QDH91858.1 hypothetical protein SEA_PHRAPPUCCINO_183 [Mycobacterium phage Phrappuccino]QIQ63299.1 hypothetical protein SEA_SETTECANDELA_183 [Mycobacterium phage Settecandela]
MARLNRLYRTATENGWTLKPHNLFDYWGVIYTRGAETLCLRSTNGRLTAVQHTRGDGIVFAPKRDKFDTTLEILTATPAPQEAR